MSEAFGNDIITGALTNLVEQRSNALASHLQQYAAGDWTVLGTQDVPFMYGFYFNNNEQTNNSYYFSNEDKIKLSVINYNNYFGFDDNSQNNYSGLNFKISLVAPNIGRAFSNDQLDITYNENHNYKNNWPKDWNNYKNISMKFTQAVPHLLKISLSLFLRWNMIMAII